MKYLHIIAIMAFGLLSLARAVPSLTGADHVSTRGIGLAVPFEETDLRADAKVLNTMAAVDGIHECYNRTLRIEDVGGHIAVFEVFTRKHVGTIEGQALLDLKPRIEYASKMNTAQPGANDLLTPERSRCSSVSCIWSGRVCGENSCSYCIIFWCA
ncbi:hypothetical protein F4779DRAFT_641661 [Xylariaceae sp. FL0662B]|nr:hypothetical protein F4779DRAFT_641661 [Xylariaceae sp. FL0662B]